MSGILHPQGIYWLRICPGYNFRLFASSLFWNWHTPMLCSLVSKLDQIVIPGSNFLPVFPVAHANSPSYPHIQFRGNAFHVRDSEVIDPAGY